MGGVDVKYKIWCIWDEPFLNYSFFVNVSFSSAAFSDFESWRFLHIRCLGGLKSKLPAKFGDYRTNGS